MSILFDGHRRVNPARPFAAGLLPPEPAPAGASVTPADRAQLDAADAEWAYANGGPSRPWELELRSLLRSLAYPACNVADAVAWVAPGRRVDGCPVVDAEDWGAVNLIVARHLADAAADEAIGGDVECDPENWPSWTDYHRFEPTPADRSWWAQESDRIESERADRELDARAAESAAVDALTAGLVPADLPPARPRRPNPMTDRDVARIGAVG